MATRADRAELRSFLRKLEELPFVRSATLGTTDDSVVFVLRTAADVAKRSVAHRIRPELSRSHLAYALVDTLLANTPDLSSRHAILLAPYVAPPLAAYLAGKGVNYADLAGNCRIVLPNHVLVSIEGRRPPPRAKADRGVRAAGYRVLFALLADPSILSRPVRTIAPLAGVSKSAVSNIVSRLEEDGFVIGARQRRLARRDELLSRLLAGYSDVLRPRLVLGRYRTQETDPKKVESTIEEALGRGSDWGWGGVSASRKLGLGYSGPEVTVHVDRSRHAIEALTRRIRAVESNSGDLVFLGLPGAIARPAGSTRVVHPLLVYLELMTTGSERLREVAATLQTQLVSAD